MLQTQREIELPLSERQTIGGHYVGLSCSLSTVIILRFIIKENLIPGSNLTIFAFLQCWRGSILWIPIIVEDYCQWLMVPEGKFSQIYLTDWQDPLLIFLLTSGDRYIFHWHGVHKNISWYRYSRTCCVIIIETLVVFEYLDHVMFLWESFSNIFR